MADRAVGNSAAARRSSLLSRLLVRWRRAAETAPAAAPADAWPPDDATAPPRSADEAPPLDRTTLLQWLWGPGYATPGNAEHVLGLVKPFGLDPAMSMLDVAAGLGSAARMVAETFGTYVTGYERDPDLAERGMAISVAQGLARRAPVSVIDPENLELRPGAFDCILGREATHSVAGKERFLRVLVLGLKPRGQLLLTEFVTEPAAGERHELSAWASVQPYRPSLWTVAQYTDCLTGLGLDIRVTEDMTAAYRGQILAGWAALLQNVDLRALPRRHLLAVVDEAERWMRAIAALESGALRMYRFYALAGAKSDIAQARRPNPPPAAGTGA